MTIEIENASNHEFERKLSGDKGGPDLWTKRPPDDLPEGAPGGMTWRRVLRAINQHTNKLVKTIKQQFIQPTTKKPTNQAV